MSEQELYRTANEVRRVSANTTWWLVAIGLLALAATGLTWRAVARNTERRLRPVVSRVADAAGEIHSAGGLSGDGRTVVIGLGR